MRTFISDCQRATLLIERRADQQLPLAERMKLWAHLRLCAYCRRYAVQSPALARAARLAAQATSTAQLPPDFAAQLQRRLDASES
ncbi:hypothetical protein [Hymenobacter swuensis]|uniref:Zinc-finger domain-containing protein n=1 Tax=Hymenobacter swuensis DY53 TaxID=1227739 RepID=W8EZQ4_9BACT|nr:hypothetical protein [Hymenobacter swuensis]AHJ98584.1 hypothetical protein Hsw_2989 [Hymenobacter swuensis DY53]